MTMLKSTVLALALCLPITGVALAEPVKIGEVVHFNSSICMSLDDLWDIRNYALAHNGDGKTRYLELKAEGKCMAFNTMELGMMAVIDEMVPNSGFTDTVLGEVIFVRFHIDGMDDMPIYGVMGREQLTLTGA